MFNMLYKDEDKGRVIEGFIIYKKPKTTLGKLNLKFGCIFKPSNVAYKIGVFFYGFKQEKSMNRKKIKISCFSKLKSYQAGSNYIYIPVYFTQKQLEKTESMIGKKNLLIHRFKMGVVC